MASMFQSVLDRASELPTKLLELFSRSPPTSSSSTSIYSQLVDDLEKLCRRMRRIGALLNDAEGREIMDDRSKIRPRELWDVAYHAEDVIDEVEYELLQYRLACEEDEHVPTTNEEERGIQRKRLVISDSLVTVPSNPLLDSSFQQQILAKVKTINHRFNEICKVRVALDMVDCSERSRVRTSSFIDEKGVRGRENDKHEIIKMLLSQDDDAHSNERIRVISIVGMGGIGKTTLAQLVYNDDEVRSHFEKRWWICVSDDLELTMLPKYILKCIQERQSELEEFSSLQESLSKELQGKRFLLVLDDDWNESHKQWERLWVSLSSGASGSRVLITTRSEEVSRISGASERNMYRLGLLSKEDCWSLFEQVAFHGRKCDDYPKLVATGQQIVDRCKGLPSAVKMLGWMLSCECSQESWEEFLETDWWELEEVKHNILPALKLSYSRLSSYLKVCFAYCGVFPKGHYFIKDELVCLWMAQCYVKPTRRRSMEEVAQTYCDDLRQRSFFEYCGGGRFKMHDLIHHQALSVSPGECAKIEGGKLSNSLEKARHLWLEGQAETERLLMPCGSNDKLQHLRTLYMIKKGPGSFSRKFLNDVFLSTKHLRVLYLCDDDISELPDSIGGLKFLRYLGISGGQLLRLPETLGNLHNLQTLQVKRARSLQEVPKSIKGLVNLRYLKLHRF